MHARLRRRLRATLERQTERLDPILDRGLGTSRDAFFPNALNGAGPRLTWPGRPHGMCYLEHCAESAPPITTFVEFGWADSSTGSETTA
jgi:hypothetical protein